LDALAFFLSSVILLARVLFWRPSDPASNFSSLIWAAFLLDIRVSASAFSTFFKTFSSYESFFLFRCAGMETELLMAWNSSTVKEEVSPEKEQKDRETSHFRRRFGAVCILAIKCAIR